MNHLPNKSKFFNQNITPEQEEDDENKCPVSTSICQKLTLVHHLQRRNLRRGRGKGNSLESVLMMLKESGGRSRCWQVP